MQLRFSENAMSRFAQVGNGLSLLARIVLPLVLLVPLHPLYSATKPTVPRLRQFAMAAQRAHSAASRLHALDVSAPHSALVGQEQLRFTIIAGASGSALLPVPGVTAVNGQTILTLDSAQSGHTLAVPVGTIVYLRFSPGYRYALTPAHGILSVPMGTYHLPNDVIGLLRVVGQGRATIIIVGNSGQIATNTSYNWSGNVVENGDHVGEVAGMWDVPPTAPTSYDAYSSAWIGVDGTIRGGALIQVGTEQDYHPQGGSQYYAWWEILPATETALPANQYPVHAFDHISAAIRQQSNSLWTIVIRDLTQGWTFVTQQSYNGPGASADWIVEAPLINGAFQLLANYGATLFDGALVNGANARLTTGDEWILQQCAPGCVYSVPSSPDNDADGFSIAYSVGSPTPPPVSNVCPAAVLTGDLNGDGSVNLTDFSIFGADWNKPRGPGLISAYSDINCDGRVNLPDFSLFAQAWGMQWPTTPQPVALPREAPRAVRRDDLAMARRDHARPLDQLSATMSISPSTGTIAVGGSITINLAIDGGGQAFNAAQATVAVSGPAQVQSLTPGDCGLTYLQVPTTTDPSFAGAILGGSSLGCTVYTLTLQVTGSGAIGITLSDASILSASDSGQILESVVDGSYNAPPTATPTQTAPPTDTPVDIATPTVTTIPTATNTPTDTPTSTATPAASLTLGRSSGRYKDSVTATGAGFGAGEAVNLYLDSTATTPLTSATSTASGSFAAVFSVPQAISGTHTVIAQGQSSGRIARAPFTMLPATFLLHYQGHQGSPDVLSGTGFAPYETVIGYWNTLRGVPFTVTATTNGIGTFGGSAAHPGITFTVPLSPTGGYAVYAVGLRSHGVAHSSFALTPYLRLVPASGLPGATIRVTGLGYGAHETVPLLYNCGTPSCTSTTVLGTLTTDGNGDVSALVTIPTSTGTGAHAIGGKGNTSGAFATTIFTVT